MYLKSLILNNFKNYVDAELQFSDKINCFVGGNGAGKTNLLDAIYYLSFCKSYFNPVDSQNIRHGEEVFAIHGHYARNGEREDQVSCIQRRNERKIFKINQKEYDRLADHIGLIPLVMISPYDRDLINEGSDVRRRYLDSVISQFDRNYLEALMAYNKVLIQRNALLKTLADSGSHAVSQLDWWDEQLIIKAMPVYEGRRLFLAGFTDLFRSYFQILTDGREVVNLQYETQLDEMDMRELLPLHRSRDLAVRYTTQGIHKDDLRMLIDGYPAKKFGSQGQQKSFVVALKLAQFEYMRQKKEAKPLLLLDDVFDKLDEKRVAKLIHLVAEERFGQVFITDTQADRVQQIFDESLLKHISFHVSGGVATVMNGIGTGTGTGIGKGDAL